MATDCVFEFKEPAFSLNKSAAEKNLSFNPNILDMPAADDLIDIDT
jgi:hypothetical protein